MPNATERANARTLPEETPPQPSRRGILGALGILIGASAGVVSTTTLASAPDSDDGLHALVERARALNLLEIQIRDEIDALTAQVVDPPVTDEALIAEADAPDWLNRAFGAARPGVFYNPRKVEERRSFLRKVFANLEDSCSWRLTKIFQGLDRHQAKVEAAYVDAGVRAAEKRQEAFRDERTSLWREIINTPALTSTGILAKLAFAAKFSDPDRLADEETYADTIAMSAMFDAQRMTVLAQDKEAVQ